MNFKKYHVSKNLLNADDWYGSYKQADGTYQALRPNLYQVKIKPFTSNDVGKTFTFSAKISPTLGNARLCATIGGEFVGGNNAELSQVTFTVASVDDILYFNYGSSSTTMQTISNIMLNTGSTALPYEPYSSEVWHDSHYIMGTDTDTITTLPADVYADGNNATVGLVGNMQQTGTPSPQNPIQPSECGERTAQLFFKRISGYYISGTGEIAAAANYDVLVAKVTAGETYHVSNLSTKFLACGFYVNEPVVGSVSYNGELYRQDLSSYDTDVTIPSGCNYIAVRYNTGTSNPMLNTGSTALPYEPYGVKIPILSGGTTTNVYLGEVQKTRKIGKYIFTGDENITRSVSANNVRMYYVIPSAVGASPLYCTHFVDYAQAAGYPPVGYCNFNNISNFIMGVDGTEFETANDFKTWLRTQYTNGNPLTVWYVLATETTGIVNEPLRKIGDYADTVSGITIPVTAGVNTLSVDTTLQPSEVTATYKGWHSVQSVHERENSQWD